PQPEGGVRLAAQLRQLRARPARAECVDPLVQRGAPAPGAGLSEPARLPGARSRSGGLIPGEHYILRVMLHTHWSAAEWSVIRVEFRKALAVRSEIRRAGWFN